MELLDHHHHHHHFVSISSIISFVILTQFCQITTAGDADVMFKFQKSITDAPPSWSGPDPCKWEGISCSRGSVININLKSKSLSGKIPPEITELTNLRDISFQKNNFNGTFPPLKNLHSLQKVYLNGNGFTSIPPEFLTNLPSLQTVSISNNPLKPWKIPDNLMNLTSIETFEAANTSLYGEIPGFFGTLPSLQELRLSYNNLTGVLPSSFSGSGIQKLWINNQESGHGLSGSISVLSEMTSLSQAWLHGNNFSGPIPDLSNCTRLSDLNVGNNQLTGVVPESLTKLPSLKNVSLQGNLLQGPIPSFGNSDTIVNFTSNSFCTTEPGPCDPQVTTLLAIAGGFDYPKLLAHSWTGNDACDDSWASISCTDKNVTGINLGRQGLTGVISPAFGELKELTIIMLNDNGLYGKLPGELTELKNLRRLDVSNNNLTGEVPKFASHVKVNLEGNKFIGTKVDTTPKSPPGGGVLLSSSKQSSPSPAPSKSSESSTSRPSRSYIAIVAVLLFVQLYIFSFTKWI